MEGNSYIKSLDGVRALAIILVMSFHSELTHFGWIGVQLFFVLSGFLITGILWKEKDKQQSLFYRFKKFWVRRSLRIFPLYFGYILVIGLSYILFHFPSYYGSYFPYLVSYTINFPLLLLEHMGNPLFNHLWSLAIEEQFYLLFPLIILLLPKNFIRFLLVFIIIASPVIRFALGEYYANAGYTELGISNGVNFNTLCQLDAFCFGGIIPVLLLDKKIKKPMTLFVAAAIVAAGAGLYNFITSPSRLSYLSDFGYYHYLSNNYQHVWHYTVLNIVFASLILILISAYTQHRFKALRTFLESKFLVRIGKVSYGMYIFHWLIWVYIFIHFFKPETALMKGIFFIPYVIIVYIVAEISYRLYESPFLKLKDKLFPVPSRKQE